MTGRSQPDCRRGVDIEALRAARRRYPVGAVVRGRVAPTPWPPGVTGLFVDLGAEPRGFLDVVHLPDEAARWPAVGTAGRFEVLQHRPGQVRLYPVDAGMRGGRDRPGARPAAEWAAVAARYPVGTAVEATVREVYVSHHTYVVEFDGGRAEVEYEEDPPETGDTGRYTVVRLLERTRRILVVPAG